MAQTKKAFITGITGQDGSYLAEQLIDKGYSVAGFIRENSTGYLGNASHLRGRMTFFSGRGLEDPMAIEKALQEFEPDEVYNLGAQASPGKSFKDPEYSVIVNYLGAIHVFESALRLQKRKKTTVKVYQASSSEMYGKPLEIPQNENTPFRPNNPYGVTKLGAHHMARIYREGTNGLFISCGILFNHESERRGLMYVSRKVSAAVACISKKVKRPPLNEVNEPLVTKDWKVKLGNLEAERDWGYSPEYVAAMQLMLQQKNPDDFVIATGEKHSVREFVEVAFGVVGLDWKKHVIIDKVFKRPLETGPLIGDYSKAKKVLGWQAKLKFSELIEKMVKHDLELFS